MSITDKITGRLKKAAGDLADRASQLRDCSPGGRVRPVWVEHHRHPHRAEERLRDRGEQSLAGGHVGAADEDRGVVEIFRPAGEDGAVHENALGWTAVSRCRSSLRTARVYFGLNGCFAVFEAVSTSSTDGFLPSAR